MLSAKSIFKNCCWFVLCFAAPALGAFAPPDAWYESLRKPSWNPPNWLFGPVWSVLYALMALSAWLVWRAGGFAGAGRTLGLFLVQLAVNALWSWLFFVWHVGSLAFGEIDIRGANDGIDARSLRVGQQLCHQGDARRLVGVETVPSLDGQGVVAQRLYRTDDRLHHGAAT